jgi:pantoate--beta-alanine ligase
METLTETAKMRAWSRARRERGEKVGLVPTMGYLHEGHLSLIRRSVSENERTVVSIFVNPTQFGPNEDLARYPRDPEADSIKCEELGVDVIFMPEVTEIYPPDFQTYVVVEEVSRHLCGAARPGHFRGVATVVLKLFNIVSPSAAYFGNKDYQQLQVIRTMVRDLDVDVRIVPCEIVREHDGLAMSSRNVYLSPDERKQALCLHQALTEARRLFANGEREPKELLQAMSDRIDREPAAAPDYISLVHPETLRNLEEMDNRALAVLAVKIGRTRLIDNLLLEARESEAP